MTPAARTASAKRWSNGVLITCAVLALVATAVLVVWRRGRGRTETEEIARLELNKRDLMAQIAELETELAQASSWSRIGPAAERRLGLREASDAQLVTLSRTSPPDAVPPAAEAPAP